MLDVGLRDLIKEEVVGIVLGNGYPGILSTTKLPTLDASTVKEGIEEVNEALAINLHGVKTELR
jgi:hypothetical protein